MSGGNSNTAPVVSGGTAPFGPYPKAYVQTVFASVGKRLIWVYVLPSGTGHPLFALSFGREDLMLHETCVNKLLNVFPGQWF